MHGGIPALSHDGIYLHGKLVDQCVACLVDTGANISIVQTGVFYRIPRSLRPELEVTSSSLVLADGSSVSFMGKASFQISIGSEQMSHQFWVADIGPDCILGLDFLRQHECIVDAKNGSVNLGCGPAEQPEKDGGDNVDNDSFSCFVAVKETTSIPPLSEIVIAGRVKQNGRNLAGKVGLFQPSEKVGVKGLLVARSVSELRDNMVPVRIANLSSDPVTLYKNTTVGVCEDVDAVEASAEGSGQATQVSVLEPGEVPEHLQQLYSESTVGLDWEQSRKVASLLAAEQNAFAKDSNDLGRTKLARHQINTGPHAPIRQAARRLPFHKQEEASKEIDEMLFAGIIEPSNSPWSSPIVLVKKKDGSLRFCIDFRRLNDITVKDSYPLPRIDDTLDMLGGANYFSTLDLASGYWQIEMGEEDKPKTAFATHRGLFQFSVMPFGLCNAPATFERLMEHVLGGMQWESCLVYLDDIIVHSKTFQEHVSSLGKVIARLREAGLKLSPKKCKLFQPEVSFLGHVEGKEGIHTDPSKVQAVRDWPVPQNVTELRSFLGLCSYYRRFIQGFSTIAKPLHRLTEKGREFAWHDDCEQAFRELKRRLLSAPILGYPMRDGLFVLDTDASNVGVGAVLSQVQDGQERVIGYFSKTLGKAERRYCVTRKELLAIVMSVKWFHHFLYGKHFLIRTDHGALRWLLRFRQPEGQVARWIETLGTYDFAIEHRPGRVHGNADGLSRRPCRDCNYCERQEKRENELVGRVPNSSCLHQKDEQPTCAVVRAEAENAVESCVVEWSHEFLQQSQERDPDILPLLKAKEIGNRPKWEEISGGSRTLRNYWLQWDSLEVKNGLLHRRFENRKGDGAVLQLIVPETLKRDVWAAAHEHPLAGHFMTKKTLNRVRERFYWSGMGYNIGKWCRQCKQCSSRKGPKSRPKMTLKSYPSGEPLQRIAMDIMGPLPTSNAGMKYVLVIADYFSKWVEIFAIPNQEAKTVAKILVGEFICRYGIPDELHSDQGRQFESAVMQEVCQLLRIRKTRTTPYHPQSDGMVERMNRTIEAMLSMLVSEGQKDWDTWLPYIRMAYNSAIHESTKFSPAELLFGTNLRTPMGVLYSAEEGVSHGPYTEYADNLQSRLERIHRAAREHLKMASVGQKRAYDRTAVDRSYERGELVLVFYPTPKKGLSRKLHRPWRGPAVVIKKVNDVLYRVKTAPRSTPQMIHFNRLMKFEGERPAWVDAALSVQPATGQTGQLMEDEPSVTSAPASANESVMQAPPRDKGTKEDGERKQQQGEPNDSNVGIRKKYNLRPERVRVQPDYYGFSA